MSSPPPSAIEPTVLILVVLVGLIARRTYLSLYGATYSPGRMFAFVGYAVVFFALFAGTTIYAALGTWGPDAWVLLAPYALTPAVVATVTLPHVRKVVRFEQRADGRTYYRLPWLVPVLYLLLFTLRLVIEVVLFGLSALFSPSLPTSLPTDVLLAVIAFDLLYSVSVGLLLGRGFGVRRAYLDAERLRAATPGPVPGGPLP